MYMYIALTVIISHSNLNEIYKLISYYTVKLAKMRIFFNDRFFPVIIPYVFAAVYYLTFDIIDPRRKLTFLAAEFLPEQYVVLV